MSTVTLQVIAKDEKDLLIGIIEKNKNFFDAIQIAIDDEKTYQELSSTYSSPIEILHYEWSEEEKNLGMIFFDRKRNWLADKCKTDFYFVIDTDDEIEKPELIKQVVDEAKKENYQIVYGYYIYSVDQDGNTDAAHWKERLIRNSQNLRWNKHIHENVLPIVVEGHSSNFDDRLRVIHHIDVKHGVESNKRNLKYLIAEYNQDKEKTDPRTLAYLGRIMFGFGELDTGRFFLEKHIARSGWDDDRYLSWCQLSDIHRLKKDYKQAIACAFEALAEKPEYPEAYFRLQDIYSDQEQWLKSIQWGEEGFKKEPPRNFLIINPSGYTWRPAITLSFSYFCVGEYEKALGLLMWAKRLAPSIQFIKDNEPIYREALEHARYVDKLLWIVEFTKSNKGGNLKKLIESIPENLYENRSIALLRARHLDPYKWSKKSIVIYCGDTPAQWSPKSVEKGVGGSEEAVIHLSREFAKLGYEVTVFNNCGNDSGVFDGVVYRNNILFNPKDAFNILIGWRCNPFNYNIQASKKIIWVHDVPNLTFNKDTLVAFDKIVVLSQYHKSLLPSNVPEEKIFVSTNGLNPKDFLGIEDIKREPHRIIYASSYDRGLERILENWGEIRKSVPDAELHCYYGWNTFLEYQMSGLIQGDDFYQKMKKLFDQEGVFEHGRVGHKELLKEYRKASILAYPCNYVGEINCIALTKAIACGCFPLTNDFAVMKERNTHGRVVTNDHFIPALITLLKKGDTAINNEGYIEANSWEKVAESWDNELFPNEVETIVADRKDWTWENLGKNDKIVDIGSNKGHIFDGWNRNNVTSVDIDEYDIPNFVRASADNLPFLDNSFDSAVLAEIVEHTKNPIEVLREARRVAKKVIITVPYEYEWRQELQPFYKIEDKKRATGERFDKEVKDANPAKEMYTEDGLAHLFHETFYTPELLKDHLTQAGFSEIKIVKIRFGMWAWLGAVCQR